MSIYPDVAAGQRVTAALMQSMLTQEIVKQADSDKVNSTFAADPELFVPLAANAIYRIEFRLLVGGRNDDDAGGGDFKTEWYVPIGASGLKSVLGPASGQPANANANGVLPRLGGHFPDTDIVYSCIRDSPSGVFMVREWCNAFATSAAGNLGLNWAQSVTDATAATRVAAGSVLRVRRIG